MTSFEFRVARGIRLVVNFILFPCGSNKVMLAKLVAILGLGIFLWIGLKVSFMFILAASFIFYLSTGGWRFMSMVVQTLPRDARALWYLIRLKIGSRRVINNNVTLDEMFDVTVSKFPNKTCFMFKDTKWKYIEVQRYVNKVANFLHSQGYRKGDVIAIYSENCPEMVGMWLGMSRLGVKAAMINYNLQDMSLVHCIKISNAKAVVFGTSLQQAIINVAPSLPKGVRYLSLGWDPVKNLSCVNIDAEVDMASDIAPPKLVIPAQDILFYIYTSGTTGLPKAAKISHYRYYLLAKGIYLFSRMTPNDVLYTSLPLYHTAGGILGVGQCLIYGIPIAIRQKFSASQFWTDCIKYKATAAQYIGEICRYLLTQPARPEDRQHTVRVVYGNGIKPQIWTEFQERFGIDFIMEFYGATEGNCSILNNEKRVGAIGYCTRIAPFLHPVMLIKVDPDTNEYIRDSRGVCIQCQPGEPGEMVGKIIPSNPLRHFDGYSDETATSKKIICDVFCKGDTAFSTGDILVMDELGFLYFRDRTGDTFRWRGENVSTNEVEDIISNHIDHKDAVVYGVEVPGCEGRAGMVAIVVPEGEGNFDLRVMGQGWCRALPSYARPIFIRVLKELDTTGTFKLKKNKLRDEGFNPNTIQDSLYFLDSSSGGYKPLDKAVYDDIVNGSQRL